ncbi:MAG: helix-turn-helix transcriptional regulator [Vulcanimicrobiota bacterium]
MSLGNSIAQFRKERGWTQAELGEKLGVHQSHVTRWENDRVRPRERTLEQIAEALQVTPEELLVGGQEALASSFNIDDPELVGMLADIPRLDEEEIGALKIVLKNFLGQVRVREALGHS